MLLLHYDYGYKFEHTHIRRAYGEV